MCVTLVKCSDYRRGKPMDLVFNEDCRVILYSSLGGFEKIMEMPECGAIGR